jgi:hypothetical protein
MSRYFGVTHTLCSGRQLHEGHGRERATASARPGTLKSLKGRLVVVTRRRVHWRGLHPLAAALVCVLIVAGCGTPRWAVVDGKRVERPTLRYTDAHQYTIEHRGAWPGIFTPGGAGTIDDGRLTGRACGMELDFDASWYGSRVSLVGRFDVPWLKNFTRTEGLAQLDLDITQSAPRRRYIVGKTQYNTGFEIDVGADQLVAQVGVLRYELVAAGSDLVGRVTGEVVRFGRPVQIDEPFVIEGREPLAAMGPADQAVMLLAMLPCKEAQVDRGGHLTRGFSISKPGQ